MFGTAIGKRYIEFLERLSQFDQIQFNKDVELLFSAHVKKVVNSKTICNNRDQLVKQMREIIDTYGIASINLLELIIGKNEQLNVLRFEITYKDLPLSL